MDLEQCGLPQGNYPGPLLYSICTNLPFVLCKASMQIYADNLKLYYAAITNRGLNKVLYSELSLVFDWKKQLVPYIAKTKSIILGCSYKLSYMFTLCLYLSGEPIQQVNIGCENRYTTVMGRDIDK